MARGFNGIGQGMNINSLMKQAQKMQKQMEEIKSDLESKNIEVTSGGGAIKIIMSGKKEIKSIEISKDVVDPDDIEMLQDLIITSVNEAIKKVDELSNKEMGKLTGGMGLPGGLL